MNAMTILTSLFDSVIGFAVSTALTTGYHVWKNRGRRRLRGEWLSAVQVVFYETENWHVQRVRVRQRLFKLVVETIEEPGKLQWILEANLENRLYLVGPWRSLRAGSISGGYMSLQISSNGKYMCGHDYGDGVRHDKAHFGIMLLGRNEQELQLAFDAMSTGQREMLPLSSKQDFPESETTKS